MPRTLRFHLDENVPAAVAEGLRRRGIDVTTTPGSGLLTTSDEAQAAYALAEGRVIFTQDTDFLRLHTRGLPHAGVVFCRQGRRGVGEIIRGLTEVWETREPDAMRDGLVDL